jgi:GT2 family glycosyltransferase
MPKRTEIAIIIVNWNQKDMTLHCLETVFANAPACSYEVVLVDNGSSDGSVDAMRRRFPDLRILENVANVGLAKANNRAMKETDSEFILLMNNDTVVKPGCIETLHAFIKEHPDAGIAGAKMFYGDGALQYSCFDFPGIINALWEALGLASLFPCSRVFGSYEMSWWDHAEPRQVDWVSTACYIARRAAFEKVEFIDPAYFVYSDDVDMGFKMRRTGYKVYYVPAAQIVHLSGRNVGHVSARKTMESTASLRYTIKKNHSYLYYQTWKAVKIAATSLKIVKWGALGVLRAGPPTRRQILAHFLLSLKYFLVPLRNVHFSKI